MPAFEYTDAKVTLTVEVDGHTIAFTETRRVRGCRYYGKPLGPFIAPTTCFEHNVRAESASATSDVMRRAGDLLQRMYPSAGDDAMTDLEGATS